MTQETINIGTSPNDGTGDPLRAAFNKTNNNFSELYNSVSTLQASDGDLLAIAALSGTNGFLKKNGTNTWILDNNTYLTGITSEQIASALGYTPYSSSNPSNYTNNAGTVTSVGGTGTVNGLTLSGSITSSGSLTLGGSLTLTSANVTSALGFTPYNENNPNGYITSANLTGLSGNTVYIQGVDLAQNTRITNVDTKAQAAFDKANTGVATSLDSFARTTANLAFAKANTALANVSGAIFDGDLYVTGEIISISAGTPDYDISGANVISANTFNADIGGYIFPDETVQISAAAPAEFTQAAFDEANTKFSYYGGSILGSVDVVNDLTVSGDLTILGTTNITTAGTFDSYARTTANLAVGLAGAAAQTVPQNAQTVNYTLQLTDAGKHIYYTQSSNTLLHIPNFREVSFSNGTSIMIVSQTTSSANVTVRPNTGVSLYFAGNTTSASRNVTTYGMASLIQVAANTWFISGAGVV
jgi:hypothetical protein